MRCKGITQKGKRCKNKVVIKGLCLMHLCPKFRHSSKIKICKEKGCYKRLNPFNITGYCLCHSPKHIWKKKKEVNKNEK